MQIDSRTEQDVTAAVLSPTMTRGLRTTVARVQVRLLGPVGVTVDGAAVELSSSRERAVLSVLALNVGRPVHVSELVDGVWGNAPPESAVRSLQSHLSRLRSKIGRDVVRTVGRDYLLDVPADAVDTCRFESLVTRGHQLASSGAPDAAVGVLSAALELWRGDPFPDLGDGPLASGERARFEELKAGAHEELAGAMIASGSAMSAVPALEMLVEENPLRERRWELLIDALYSTGRQADALRAYQRVRECLIEEAGIEPGPALRAAESRVVRQEPVVPAAPPTDIRSLPSGTVSLLLTDIEGSTSLWDNNPAAMGAVVEHHTNLIGEAVVRHGGTLLKAKGEGDSTFSVFADAGDAVAAAIDAREALAGETWDAGIDLAVRLAVSTGQCEHRDGDYFGTTVNRAARVRGVADGNELLLSAATYNLVADTTLRDHPTADRGVHQLKGIQRPERIWQVIFDANADSMVEAAAFDPAATSDLSWAPSSVAGFVGRVDQRDALARSWVRAQNGEQLITLISGEPGVGKTSLAGDFARRAVDDGGVVLFGRCPSDGSGSMTPIAEMISSYMRRATPSVVHEQLGRMGAIASELLRIAPVLSEVVPQLPAPLSFDPEEDRRRLMSAVAAFVDALAVDAPVVVIVDDLHWGDSATIAALGQVMTSLGEGTSMLLLGTYRDTDVVRGHPFAAVREDFRQRKGSERIDLSGLGHAEVRSFLEVACDQDLDADTAALAELLWRETGGNPLFVGEVLAHLTESGMIVRRDGRWVSAAPVAELPVPQGLAETIGLRLDRLSDAANATLRTAAVVGSRFDAYIVDAALGAEAGVMDAIDEAIGARLIAESATFGAFEFTHAVVRSTLLAELTMTRRVGIYWRIGELLQQRDAPPVETAFHLFEGVLAGDIERAAAAGLAAARQSVAVSDQQAAIGWAEQSLQLLSEADGALELRADLVNERANAMSNDWTMSATQARIDAIDAAVTTGDPTRIGASTALIRTLTFGIESPDLTAALARGLEALSDQATAEKVKVLTAEAFVGIMSGSGRIDRVVQCVNEALALVEPDDIDAVIGIAQLVGSYGGALPEIGLHMDTALKSLEQYQPLSLTRLQRITWMSARQVFLFSMGRFHEADLLQAEVELDDPDRIGPLRVVSCSYQAGRACARGDLRDIESMVDNAVAEAMKVDGESFHYVSTLATYILGVASLHQDLAVRFEPILADMRRTQPLVAWTSAHSIPLAATGRNDEAIEAIELTARDDFALLPANSYSHGLLNITIGSVLAGHLRHLPAIRQRLSVRPDGLIGHLWGFWGSNRQTLGWISMALGEPDRAMSELTLAAEQFETAGMRAFHAWALQDLAELHNSLGDPDTARRLSTEAREEADECGATMTMLRADVLLDG